jgi:plasmid replication initiation protein
MVPNTPNNLDALLPDRHPQRDFFVCDVADAVLKDLIPKMEHPFYALSKKPDTAVRRHQHGDKWLEVIPSVKGQATIYDKDILIYVVSQVMEALNRGEKVSREIRFNPRDLLMFTNRGTGGKDYEAFCEGLDRLMGTVIKTNITTASSGSAVPLGDEEETGRFHLIEKATVRRKNGSNGRILWAEITISEWIFNSIRRNQVLTLHPDYFRLRKPIERRVYEIARKFCGHSESWKIGLDKLLSRTGARTELKRFRHTIREMARTDHLPDYHVYHDDSTDQVIFRNRGSMIENSGLAPWGGNLDPDVYHDARQIAPGWDVREIERQWRDWLGSKSEAPRSPERSFLGFCKTWQNKRGRP